MEVEPHGRAGRLAWSIDGNDQKISNSYDDLGRRTAQWAGEIGTGTKLAEWSYDTLAKGQPTAATRHTAGRPYTQTVTGYDSDYRPTGSKVTIPAGEGALGGDYTTALDAAGNLREQTLPAAGGLPAEKVTFSYTDLGFADSMTSDLGGFTYIKNTAFTLTGKLESRSLGANGQIKRLLERDPTTDWLSRVTTQAKADTSTPDTVQDDRYGYNIAGNITRVLDAASATGGTDGQDTSMVYDAAGERLIRRDPDAGVTLYLGSTELKLIAGQVTAKRYYSSSDASLIVMRQSSGVTWMLAGLHGSTQLAVNDTTGALNCHPKRWNATEVIAYLAAVLPVARC